MATLSEDDVLEQLDAQDNLFSFMKLRILFCSRGYASFCRRCLSITMKRASNMQ